MKYVRKIWAAAAAVCLIAGLVLFAGVSGFALAAPESEESIVSEGYCVVDVDTGEILLEKNRDERYYPASTTKVMTALVVLENVSDLNATLTYSDWAINSLSWDSSTLQPEAAVGEQMSVLDTLYGMILMSGNECANALAEYTSGSVEAFTDLMNAKAAELGAVNTHFANAHGLHDENHYTTPYDLMLIFRAALQNDLFLQIDSTAHYQIPATNLYGARQLDMGHQMIVGNYEYPYAVAGKTGSTPEAGRTLVTYAVKGDVRLISVIMKSTDEAFYQDTEKLLDEGFAIAEKNHEAATDSGEGLNVTGKETGGETVSAETEKPATESETVHVTDRSEETSWLFWAILATAALSLLVSVVLVVLILWDMITSHRQKSSRRRP